MNQSIWDISRHEKAIIGFQNLLDLQRRVKWAMIAITGSTKIEPALDLIKHSGNIDCNQVQNDIELVEKGHLLNRNSISREQSKKLVERYFEVWSYLSTKFVTQQNSLNIAAQLHSSQHIEKIILFGSLARNDQHPKDIDLMIMDNGYYSLQRATTYSVNDWATIKLFTEIFDSGLNRFMGAVLTGWLDILTLNGSALTSRASYASAVVRNQQDGAFFNNISRDLLVFDQQLNRWTTDSATRQQFADIHHKFSRSRRWPRDRRELRFPQSRRRHKF